MKKFRLKENFTCEYGFKHLKGDIGSYNHILDGKALFNFEGGYAKERAKHKKAIAEYGEGFNIVPWCAFVPLSILEPF